MQDLFTPTSIAVIGASADEEKIGGLLVKYLQEHGYNGDIYPINPNHDRLQGLPCYTDVEDLPDIPDVALVSVPASLVVDLVKDCLETGIENILIVSSGFSETGSSEGADAEAELDQLASTYDATIVGPNAQGFINFPDRVAASFSPTLKRNPLVAGNTSFVTQSGAFGGALTTIFQDNHLGLNVVIATGNEASTEALDFVDFMATDDESSIVAGYIEGFEDGRKLIELKRTDAGIDLPIVVLKVGQSSRAKEAAKSHTGKIAGRQDIYEAVFKETGVISVESTSLLVSTCKALSRLTKSSGTALPGQRVGVVTTSGGAGVLLADVIAAEGLELPRLSDDIRQNIEELIPDYGSSTNPIDSTAQVSVEERCGMVEALLEEDDIDVVVFQITNADGEYAAEYAKSVIEIVEANDTPVFVCWTGGFDKSQALDIYREANIPVFEDPTICVKTIAAISQFQRSKPPLRASKDLPARVTGGTSVVPTDRKLTEVEAKSLLQEYGIRTPNERLVTSAAEAASAAEQLGYPLIAKVVASDLDHRNEIGGIRSALSSKKDVRIAYEELEQLSRDLGLDLEGIVVQEQVDGELELGIGLLTETVFGPLVMVGRGGTDIEETEDVTFRTIPLSEAQAMTMLEDLESVDKDELTDYQRESIVSSIVAVSNLYQDNQWIVEGDINPLLVVRDGTVAVDGLFIGEE